MLSRLMRALSFEDPSVRPFCEYFNMLQGEGGGKPRVWDWSVYSGETQAALLPGVGDTDRFDEWARISW